MKTNKITFYVFGIKVIKTWMGCKVFTNNELVFDRISKYLFDEGLFVKDGVVISE